MVEFKIWTDVSFFSGRMGASVTPGKRIPRKKINVKLPKIYPPRKDQIPNKYINIIIS